MGKVYTKHILRLLWKMVENVFFLDSEHVGIGGMVAPQKLPFLLNGMKQVQVLGYSPRCHHSPPLPPDLCITETVTSFSATNVISPG